MLCLFFDRVRRMIRCDHINTVIQHRLQDRFFMMRRLNGRITLDFVAQCPVVFRIEPQMVNAGLGSHELRLAVRE
ncbi:hypothetical protein D3C86_1982040 [compost metagenome]